MIAVRKRVFVFVLAYAAAMLLFLPLRWVAGRTGVAAQEVTGNAWSGRMVDAQWRRAGLGDLDAGISPLALLTGQGRMAVAGPGLRGTVLGGPRNGVAGMTGIIDLAGVTPLPLGRLEMTDLDIGFAGAECVEAGGSVRISAILPGAGETIFAGAPRCEGGKLLLPLAAGGAKMDIQVGGDGGYTAMINLDGVDEAARMALLASGFQSTPTGVVLNLEGRL